MFGCTIADMAIEKQRWEVGWRLGGKCLFWGSSLGRIADRSEEAAGGRVLAVSQTVKRVGISSSFFVSRLIL